MPVCIQPCRYGIRHGITIAELLIGLLFEGQTDGIGRSRLDYVRAVLIPWRHDDRVCHKRRKIRRIMIRGRRIRHCDFKLYPVFHGDSQGLSAFKRSKTCKQPVSVCLPADPDQIMVRECYGTDISDFKVSVIILFVKPQFPGQGAQKDTAPAIHPVGVSAVSEIHRIYNAVNGKAFRGKSDIRIFSDSGGYCLVVFGVFIVEVNDLHVADVCRGFIQNDPYAYSRRRFQRSALLVFKADIEESGLCDPGAVHVHGIRRAVFIGAAGRSGDLLYQKHRAFRQACLFGKSDRNGIAFPLLFQPACDRNGFFHGLFHGFFRGFFCRFLFRGVSCILFFSGVCILCRICPLFGGRVGGFPILCDFRGRLRLILRRI